MNFFTLNILNEIKLFLAKACITFLSSDIDSASHIDSVLSALQQVKYG